MMRPQTNVHYMKIMCNILKISEYEIVYIRKLLENPNSLTHTQF